MEVYELGLPAVMAGAQALAEVNGIPINQGILRDAEACITAAICPEDECSFFVGHEGPHSHILLQEVTRLSEALEWVDTLTDIVEQEGASPIVELAKEFLHK